VEADDEALQTVQNAGRRPCTCLGRLPLTPSPVSSQLLSAQPTVQPLRVVQPDAVCEVGGSTPGLSHGDLGIFLGGCQTEEFVH